MENEIKVIRGFAVSMGNDYVEFFKNIEDAKNNYDCCIQKEPGWHIIPNQQGNGKRNK